MLAVSLPAFDLNAIESATRPYFKASRAFISASNSASDMDASVRAKIMRDGSPYDAAALATNQILNAE